MVRRSGVCVIALAAALTLAGCGSSAQQATPVKKVVTTTTADPTIFRLCPDASYESELLSCISNSVAAFWSAQLGEPIRQKVVFDAKQTDVPAKCQSAIASNVAFTCGADQNLYVTSKYSQMTSGLSDQDRPYAYAALISHEIAHVIQSKHPDADYAMLKKHIITTADLDTREEASQRVEQQADCLSGVWAKSVSQNGLNLGRFQTISKKMAILNTTQAELASHGTLDARTTAIARGIVGGTADSCGFTKA